MNIREEIDTSSKNISYYIIYYIIQPLIIIGALNWGLIGAFGINIVEMIFEAGMVSKAIYLLVGLAGLIQVISFIMTEGKKLT